LISAFLIAFCASALAAAFLVASKTRATSSDLDISIRTNGFLFIPLNGKPSVANTSAQSSVNRFQCIFCSSVPMSSCSSLSGAGAGGVSATAGAGGGSAANPSVMPSARATSAGFVISSFTLISFSFPTQDRSNGNMALHKISTVSTPNLKSLSRIAASTGVPRGRVSLFGAGAGGASATALAGVGAGGVAGVVA
jgi:hypothetical protein